MKRVTYGGSLARNARGSLVRSARFGGLGALTFGGSLVRNARFGDLALDFKEEVSYEMLTLVTLTRDFWRKYGTKRSFWRLGASLLEEVLYETTCFGDLALHFWSWTQKWPVCSTNVVRERAFRSWAQTWPVCSTNVAWERFIPQFRFRLEPFRYNAYSYYAFGPPCRLVLFCCAHWSDP